MADDYKQTSTLLNSERCQRLRDTFECAVELPPDQWQAWLTDHVADADDRQALRLLLEAADHAHAGPLDLPSTERLQRIGPEPPMDAGGLVGRRIGGFRLLRLLGEGGMAAVFLAEREGTAFRQQVAVKLLRRGLYSTVEQRLFRREQQALAALSHGHIARLIDGGVTEAGVPYLVLEYVAGMPITCFVAHRRLDLRARLRLFVVVCRAVAAAHRQLIVHRDLKPSNILVDTEGQVKLLDFGIAKLLAEEDDGATRTGASALTPGYAAPEQYTGAAITTATDVYGLGVLLQELLTGVRPEDGVTLRRPSARLHAIPAVDATMPMPRIQLRTALRGDLDNIVMMACAAEPERRYASASELADDIERHLDAQPVIAHPPSGWYRMRKFVRRHRGSVAFTAAVSLAILASLGVAIWQARVARVEAANARAEAQRADTTRNFIEQLFQPVQQQIAEGRMPGLRELVAEGVAQIEADSTLAPAQTIDLLMMFSRLQHSLAETQQSLALAEKAHALAEASLPEHSPQRLEATFALGLSRLQNIDYTGAEPVLKTVERQHRLMQDSPVDTIELFAILARLENELGRPHEALRYTQREFAARQMRFGPDEPGMASGYNNLGYAYEAVGRFDDAIDAYEMSLAIDEYTPDGGSLERAIPLGNLAQAEYNAGRLHDARLHFERALAIHSAVALAKPSRTYTGQLTMLAMTELALGEFERAEQAVERLQVLARAALATDTDRSNGVRLAASLAYEQGDPATALTLLDGMERLAEPLDVLLRPRVLARRDLLRAEILLLHGDARAAAELARRSLDTLGESVYPPQAMVHALALLAQACAAAAMAPHTADRITACAGETREVATAALSRPYFSDHPSLIGAQVALARVELIHDVPSAVARLQSAIAAASAHGVAAESPRLAQARAWLAVAYAHSGDCSASARLRMPSNAHSVAPLHPLVAEARRELDAYRGCRPH